MMEHNRSASQSGVSFLVLYAQNIAETLAFYTSLGLEFKREKHGEGPVHHCCQLDALALEIYPAEDGEICASTMIGITVADLDKLPLPQMSVEAAIAPFGEGRRVIIRDPDGRRVFVIDENQPQNRDTKVN